jgi:tetratricopeptide (TPR) repeat protein
MALTRLSTNVIFACIVGGLALTSAMSIFNFSKTDAVPKKIVGQAPENHLPVDAVNRLVEFQKLLASDPGNADYLSQIANLYYDAGEYANAAEYYQKTLNIRPGEPNIETDLATCFYNLGQSDKSLEILDAVLSRNPGFTQAKFNKGIVLIYGKKDAKAGIAVWEDLLRENPEYGQRAELEQKIKELKVSMP